MSSNKARYYRGYKYRVWQGYSGHWYWTVDDVQYAEGDASDKRTAAKQARQAIDKRADHRVMYT